QLPDSESVVTRLALISVALSIGALVLSEVLARRAGGAGRDGHVL
ncbi:MAG: molybdate ABC transporter permease subunit, partial [Novosphingobium sp.]